MVSKVALIIERGELRSLSPMVSREISAEEITQFLEKLRPIAEFTSIGDVSIDLTQEKCSLVITTPDYEATLLEDFLETLRPIVEYENLGKVHVEILEDETEATNKLYIVIIEFQGMIDHIEPTRYLGHAKALFKLKTGKDWDEYDQMEKGQESLEFLGNFAGSFIHEFEHVV